MTKTSPVQTLPRTHYNAREVAAMVGLTYRSVIALTKTGEIPARYFGKHIRIPASWVREQLDAA